MRARLEFKGGVAIQGDFQVDKYLTGWEWTFESSDRASNKEHRIEAIIPLHDSCSDGHPTKAAALEDFKRYGTILEE